MDRLESVRLEAELRDTWARAGNYRSQGTVDTDAAWTRLQARMAADQQVRPQLRVTHRRSLLKYVAAASVALILAFGGWWVSQPATQWHTQAGEQLAVTLPDGSQVQLNENSSLQLHEAFNQDGRIVELKGEAYFEVTKSQKGDAFIVLGDGSTVTVLGTAFNFRSYPDEQMCDVEVTEGKVRFACESAGISQDLVAGNRARIMGYSNLLDLSHTAQNATAWRRGYLQFRDTPLADALIDLTHFYGVTFDADGVDLTDCPLNGRFTASDRDGLIEVLRKTFGLDVQETTPDRFTISGEGCRG